MFFFKIHPACQSDANGIKLGSNQKMTDKHSAEYSKAVCWDVNLSVRDAKIVHTTKFPRSIGLLYKIAMFNCTDKFSYK